MDKLTAKKLVMVRNIIIVLGIVIAFAIWLLIPAFIENNGLVHVGNGRYGSKIGFLLFLGIPMFALIPPKPGSLIPDEDGEEIHSVHKPRERNQRDYRWKKRLQMCLIRCIPVFLNRNI